WATPAAPPPNRTKLRATSWRFPRLCALTLTDCAAPAIRLHACNPIARLQSAEPPFACDHDDFAADHAGKDRTLCDKEHGEPGDDGAVAQRVRHASERAGRLHQDLRDDAGEDGGGDRPHPHQPLRPLVHAADTPP